MVTPLWQRSGCVVVFVGGRTGMTASGVASFGVVAGQPAETSRRQDAVFGQHVRSCRISRLSEALKDSASALSALDPTHRLDDTTIIAEFRESP